MKKKKKGKEIPDLKQLLQRQERVVRKCENITMNFGGKKTLDKNNQGL